jgi:dipeptidyl aminopeptidase/acylaminoacyl peptidase
MLHTSPLEGEVAAQSAAGEGVAPQVPAARASPLPNRSPTRGEGLKATRRLVCGLIAALCLAQASHPAEKRPLTLDDIYRVQEASAPVLSPDGEWVAYAVAHDSPKHNKTASDLWLARYDGSERLQLTRSETERNTRPRWSPDGRWIAFLSDRADPDLGAQVWLFARSGGEPRQLTEMKGDVSDFAWSPDSKRLVLVAADEPADKPDKNAKESEKKPPKPIVIDRYQFKEDITGYLTNERRHLYAFDIATKNATQLTAGAHDEWFPTWSPDGKRIAYVSKRGDDPDRTYAFHIYLIEPHAGATERALTDGDTSDQDPYWESSLSFSPDGKRIAFLRADETHWLGYAPWLLSIVDIDTGKVTTPAAIDRCFFKPKWGADGKSVYALIEQSRTINLNRIDLATGKVTTLDSGARLDSDFDVARNRLVVASSDDAHPAAIYAVDNQLRAIGAHNDWLADVALQPEADIEYAGSGKETVHGYLIKPAGQGEGTRYPTILRIHGGPAWQFYHEFRFDWQLFAARGYVVIAANPHGSTGRGLDYAKAIYADWGHRDVEDELALVDYAVKRGIADPDRLGIGGWSYGAILTDYVIASDTRFKAAVSGAGTANILGFYGIDEYTRDYERELGTPWQHADVYLRLSYPLLHADRITTPTLFLCAEKDFNVPCAGAEAMYQALRSLKLDTRLVIYPGEYHDLDVPEYLRDRLERYLGWYDMHLKSLVR